MLIVLNLPLIRNLGAALLLCRTGCWQSRFLFFCCIGVYSLNNSAQRGAVHRFFGARHVFMKLDCEAGAPVARVPVGPMMETYMRRAMPAVPRRSDGVPGTAAVADVPHPVRHAACLHHPANVRKVA